MLRIGATRSLLLILIFLISTDLSILLNIPVFRQILGSIFLTFVPGWLFLCILKQDRLGLTEKFVLSVGLSISLIIFIGILINISYPLCGYETPLSLKSLVTSFTFALMILAVIAHLRGFDFFAKRNDLSLDARYKAIVLIPIFFLPLSVLGMHIMNTKDNNAMIMAMLFLISIYIILISVFHNKIPEQVYPLIILMISISLVLLMGMRSNHIIGSDTHMEYYIFLQTLSNEKWQILNKNTLDSCLSISIFPVIYQSFLNINPEYLFKILYPILFSISPLLVYIITREYLSEIYAFLASVFFMSQNIFLMTTANSRTTVAILFFGLTIVVLLNGRLSEFVKKLLFIIFIFSCIVSHYSTTYIFFFMMLFAAIGIQIMYRLSSYKKRPAAKKIHLDNEQNVVDSTLPPAVPGPLKTNLTLGILTIFFMVIFVWYSQVTGAAFDRGMGFIVDSINSLQDFFILESRQEFVASAFGSGVEDFSVPGRISFVFRWLTILFIGIGVMNILFRYRQGVALPYVNMDDHFGLLRKKFNIEFFFLCLICSAIMLASVALPFVSKGYGIERTYLLVTVVLSSFFILGGMTVAQLIRVRWKYLVILVILVPYFMCITGTTHQIFGYPGSIVLSSEGDNFDIFYIYDQEVFAAKWLKMYVDEGAKLYSDNFGERRLISQGLINVPVYSDSIVELVKKNVSLKDGYVYLRYCAVVEGKLYGKGGNAKWHYMSEYQDTFNDRNVIYANGGSVILANQ